MAALQAGFVPLSGQSLSQWFQLIAWAIIPVIGCFPAQIEAEEIRGSQYPAWAGLVLGRIVVSNI